MSDRRTEARLVLLAHGSRDPGWRAPFERLAQELTKSLGPGRVRLAYLEFNLPTLSDALAEASLEGVSHVRILPLFTASGKHGHEDVPREVATARQATPDTTFELLPPLGDDPRFVAHADRGPGSRPARLSLLVGRFSPIGRRPTTRPSAYFANATPRSLLCIAPGPRSLLTCGRLVCL